ncbi:SdpA family antimicrobial peptide system protein [Streptomyces corynorhini]|uniref:SdpA family antimicrobial peptide system protein n=1 Tax=Streptomyces corynorhini TaxID=2282652 RepID=A0A370AXZ2_9ACTN|nr:SdpA family antimicrobial peptide system protein [Streptomyces corynorhini]RDG34507.1 SdpA family antimicrobial peptide system protein [Streptomyces corynorhini]
MQVTAPDQGSGENTAREMPAGDRGRLGRVLIAVTVFWMVIGGYVLHTQLPSNAVELPGQQGMERTVRVMTPQGWAFFTKSPRDAKITVWSSDSTGRWRSAMLAPHSEPRNAFGLNRESRAQGVELGQLQAHIRPETWIPCEDGALAACLAEVDDPVEVKTPVPSPLLCGRIGVTQQEVLPWAWSDSEGTMEMPGKVAVLDVTC